MWGKWFLLGPEKYEKTEHSKFKSFLFISWEAEILATAKTQNMGIVNLLSTGKLWENTNILKVLVLLHIPHSFISCVIETHKIPWEIWIFIVRGTSGKTRTFQSYRSLAYFAQGINAYNSQIMGKVNSHSKENIWENTGISKSRVSFFLLEAELHAVPKTWKKKDFHSTWKVWGNTKHLKFMGFLNISCKTELYTIRQSWEKWIPIMHRV